jgi:hypothetical protein
VPENIQFSFSCSFPHSLTAQFNVECMGPLTSVTLCISVPKHVGVDVRYGWCITVHMLDDVLNLEACREQNVQDKEYGTSLLLSLS